MTPNDELHNKLADLHQLLLSMDEVDDRTRRDLQQVAKDIENTLANEDRSELTLLRERLKDSVLEFEVSHPTLTSIVGNITDLLAGIGI